MSTAGESRMDAQQAHASFEGWGILEIMGHQRYAGYVTSQAFGGAVLFRVDIPELPERERVIKGGEYVGSGKWMPAGTTVTEGKVPGYSKLFGAASIYCLTPVTEEAAKLAVDRMQPRPLLKADVPPERALAAAREPAADDFGGADGQDDDEDDDAGEGEEKV